MASSLAGRIALVTGAGSAQGIGFATARMLARQGAKVAITSTTERIHERGSELHAERAEAISIVGDLLDYERAQRMAEEVVSQFGRIDILVNNAGMIQTGHAEQPAALTDLSEQQWDRDIALNLKTTFNMTKAALPHMLRVGFGRIINVSSTTGPLVSNPRETSYSAAKAAMIGFTLSLALEVARQGITVNAVAPGWIATASSTERELIAGRHTPIGRSGRPEEVAAVICFLASESASYITGQMIVVDGGNAIQEFKGPETYYP